MNEVQHEREQENNAFGEFLVKAVADSIGIEPDPKKIDRAIYKGTSCGAWVRFDDRGVVVGTIVEGSDAEFSKRIDLSGVEANEEGKKLFCKRFWAAIQQCEDFAEEHFGVEEDDA